MSDLTYSHRSWSRIPDLPGDYLNRERLEKKLGPDKNPGLTLVCAPSGYGKSLLISSWLQKNDMGYAWLSLSPEDAGMTEFLKHFAQAVGQDFPEIEEDLLSDEVPAKDPIKYAQKRIREALSFLEAEICIVLDDYHLVRSPDLDSLVLDMVEYPMPNVRWVIISRQDPSLPLTRWRMNNQITEIRSVDLRFSSGEIGRFVEISSAIALPPQRMEQLETLTEGWISGLRLLLLAIPRDQLGDPSVPVESFRYHASLFDLVGEFLEQLSETQKHSLLRLSLVSDFDEDIYAGLCVEKEGKTSSQQDFLDLVQMLRESNLFLVPTDQTHTKFRFHHLFQDLLTGLIPTFYSKERQMELHARIARVFLQKKQYERAIDHFLESGEISMAMHAFAEIRTRVLALNEWPDLERIFMRFPSELVQTYSLLGLTRAWILIYKGNIPSMLDKLDALSIQIEHEECDTQVRIQYMGELEVLRAYGRYNFNIDFKASLNHSKRALQMLGDSNSYATGMAWVFYGGSLQALGESEKARDEIYAELEEGGEVLVQAHLYLILCYINYLEAELRDLLISANHLVRFGQINDQREALANGYYFLGVANYYLNRGNKARKAFDELSRLSNYTLLVHHFFGMAAQAFLQVTSYDDDRLEEILSELDLLAVERGGRVYRDFSKAIASTLLWISKQDSSSLKWARTYHEQELIPMSNFTSTPILRAYILASSPDVSDQKLAVDILEACIVFLESHHNTMFLIRARIILTLAYARLGQDEKRDKAFIQALRPAVPGNLILPFRMLASHFDQLLGIPYLDDKQQQFIQKIAADQPGAGYTPDPLSLLSRREVEIYGLLCQQLTSKEIGNRLYISEKTVKRHLANIYQKLRVTSRKEAIALSDKSLQE